MGIRRKAVVAMAAGVIIAAFGILAAPLLFQLCEAPMHCYYSYKAETGAAVVIASAGFMMIVSRSMEPPRLLSVVTAAAGVFVILFPSSLIGVCGSPKMPCHYGLLPVWSLLGAAVLLLSIIIFFTAREEKV